MSQPLEQDLLPFAMDLAREAGATLMRYFRRDFKVRLKGRIDLVTEADIASEKLVVRRIKAKFPQHQIVGEEGFGQDGSGDYTWIVDPLDGTTNFTHGYPCFCVSIGLKYRNGVVVGVVFNPILNELFHAVRGAGAFLNGKRISVSQTKRLEDSLISTGFPYDIKTNPDNNLNYFSLIALNARAVRRDGAAALDLCSVAAGRFDGFWELRLPPWDTAAGVLMVEEAGGRVSDFGGQAYDLHGRETIASNGRIHSDMLQLFANRQTTSDHLGP